MEADSSARIDGKKSNYKVWNTSSRDSQALAIETGIRELKGRLDFSHLPRGRSNAIA
jgi:hypothetical protein